MRYEPMGQTRARWLDVPQLLGGLNTSTDAALIEDDELCDVCNLTVDHGALVTREAVRAVGDEPITEESGTVYTDAVLRRPIETDGTFCAAVLTSVKDSEGDQDYDFSVDMVPLNGEQKHRYTMSAHRSEVAIAPADKQTHGGDFLMYHRGMVFVPDEDTNSMIGVDEDKLYAPLVMINGRSVPYKEYEPGITAANGVMYEGFNCLTERYRAQFTPSVGEEDPAKEIYHMPTSLSLKSFTVEITHPTGTTTVAMSGVNTAESTFEIGDTAYGIKVYNTGSFVISPPLPVTDIAGTVTVTAYREPETADNRLAGASEAIWFGGTQNKRGGTRLFLADKAKSRLMWSDANNPFYFPENNYMYVGDLSQTITALEKQGDMLVIFKEREMFYTTYVQGEVDAEAVKNGTNVDVTTMQAHFPLTQLSANIGCRCPDSVALCRDRLVWMDSDARVYTLVMAGLYSERNVREIGQKVRRFLLKNTTEEERKKASAADHKGKYRVMIGNRMVEFDYNDSGFVNVSGYASGERAARNLAWMAHKYNFTADAVQTLISDGADKAVVISTLAASESSIVRTAYVFDEERTSDRYLAGNTVKEQPVAVSLTTKIYEFGNPAAYKRITALLPIMKASGAQLYCITDGVTPPYGKAYHSEALEAHMVMPCVHRCRTFGLRIDAEGDVCIQGLRMQYRMFGTVK